VKVCYLDSVPKTTEFSLARFENIILLLWLQLGTRLIELLLDSAFVQSPADQTPDSSPDFRPAFKHVLRKPIVENG
jgi:hypothetical protein